MPPGIAPSSLEFTIEQLLPDSHMAMYDRREASAGWRLATGSQLSGAEPDDRLLVSRHEPGLFPHHREQPLVLSHPVADGLYDVSVRIREQGEWPAGFLFSLRGTRAFTSGWPIRATSSSELNMGHFQ